MTVYDSAIHERRSNLPIELHGSEATGWWGNVLLIATDLVLFASLISSYFYLHLVVPTWPPAGIPRPELTIASIETVVLLLSSAPMVWAERSIHHGNQRGLRWGLLLNFVLGAIFLALQFSEYSGLEFGPQQNAYAAIFYTTTGFHGLHVAFGLLMNLFLQLRAWLGHFTARRYLAVQNVALFWHFVDAVWIVIFLSLYLSPRLG